MINQRSMSLKIGASSSIMHMWRPFILYSDSAPGYHCDNNLITKGCIGRRIGITQRIRVTAWNQKHINYTKCVNSERVGIIKKHREPLDPMKWVGIMNTCKAQVEEIIRSELIYV